MHTQMKKYRTTTAVFAHLLATLPVSIVNAQAAVPAGCFSLASSKMCAELSSFNVQVSSGSGLFNDLASFDAFIGSQADQNPGNIQDFKSRFDCPGYNGTSQRYHLSILCGIYVDVSSSCNPPNTIAPLCKDSTTAYLNSLTAIFADTNQCNQAPGQDSSLMRSETIATATYFDKRLGNAAGCIQAVAASGENVQCGFHGNAQAIQLCNGSRSACCNSVQGVFNGTTTSSSVVASGSSSATMTATDLSTSLSTNSSTTDTATASSVSSSTDGENTDTATDTIFTQVEQNEGNSDDVFLLGLSKTVFIAIFASAGAVVLLLLIIIICCCCRRKRREERSPSRNAKNGANLTSVDNPFKFQSPRAGYSDMPRSNSPTKPPNAVANAGNLASTQRQEVETMEAIFNFVPDMDDEIHLYIGDSVIVRAKFDDGWGYGYNLSTKKEGTFPLACVAPYDALVDPERRAASRNTNSPNSQANANYGRRQSSLVGGYTYQRDSQFTATDALSGRDTLYTQPTIRK